MGIILDPDSEPWKSLLVLNCSQLPTPRSGPAPGSGFPAQDSGLRALPRQSHHANAEETLPHHPCRPLTNLCQRFGALPSASSACPPVAFPRSISFSSYMPPHLPWWLNPSTAHSGLATWNGISLSCLHVCLCPESLFSSPPPLAFGTGMYHSPDLPSDLPS